MNTPILNVRGIGPATADLLIENGITSAEQLAAQKVGTLAAVKGFCEARAQKVIADAQALFAVSTSEESEEESTPVKNTDKNKKKKAKKKPAKKAKKNGVKKNKKKKRGKKAKKKKKE